MPSTIHIQVTVDLPSREVLLSVDRAGKYADRANIDAVRLPGVRRNRKPRHVKPVPDPQDTATRPRIVVDTESRPPITVRVMVPQPSGWLAHRP